MVVPPPASLLTMAHAACGFVPSMLAVRTGQPIKIRNSDDTLHNIHPRPTKNAEFNIGQPFKGMETVKKFDVPEVGVHFEELY